MKMSEGVEWALHCVTIFAAVPEGVVLPAKALAEYHGVSETYLLKHLKALAQADILESVPGPRGGYRLKRPAHELTFLDVVEAIEGREPAFRCSEIRQRGPICHESSYRVPCAIHVAMLAAERAWRDSLRRQTVMAMAEHLRETLDPRLQKMSAAWFAERVRD